MSENFQDNANSNATCVFILKGSDYNGLFKFSCLFKGF